jgi:Protein of unknown function (DUF998)
MNHPVPARDGEPVLAHLSLRRGVGFLGLSLPIVLILGKIWLDGGGLLGSISGYYYTSMRDYFVGTMCAMGVFLALYRYRREDRYLSDALAVFAVGVALFPTNPAGANPTTGQTIIGYIHLVCASLFFLCMAYFSLALFTRTDPRRIPTRQKRRRNVLYRVCGIAIVACLVLVVATNFLLTDHLKNEVHPLLWLETVAIWAFSVSWLVKGEFLFLKDESPDRGSQGLR